MISEPLPVLYEDDNFVAVDKPAGLLVHRTELCSDRTAALQIVRNQIGHHVYPVHRLDRATAGVLLFGKTPEDHSFAAEQFASRTVRKSYLAVIRGWTEEIRGTVDSPIKQEDGVTQEAVTNWESLLKIDYPAQVSKFPTSRYSLMRAYPRSGRMHQIRRHLRRLSGPIIGDTNYGDGVHNRFFRSVLEVNNLMLFAECLKFKGKDNKEITVEAPLPPHFHKVFDFFKWDISMIGKPLFE